MTSTRTLRIERTFDCSPQALWDAWTRPEQLAKWFGPFPAEGVVPALDLRPGGRYRLAMRDEAGREFPVWGTYVVVEPPTRLVFTAEAKEVGDHVTSVTVELEAVGARTRMRMEQSGLPAAVAGDTETGWRRSFDKLALLARATRGVSA